LESEHAMAVAKKRNPDEENSLDPGLVRGLSEGARTLVTWADILDRINVFPVPDGDTGRNLVITLAPLQRGISGPEELKNRLLMSARGNSGNIAANFFAGFLDGMVPGTLVEACKQGRDMAYAALKAPKAGTVLSLFDALVEALKQHPVEKDGAWVPRVIEEMESAVLSTRVRLPELAAAGVVDAGALGMFLFFRACFCVLGNRPGTSEALPDPFKPFLEPVETWKESVASRGYCLDAVVRTRPGGSERVDSLSEWGEEAIATTSGDILKIHLHTSDREGVRQELAGMGDIVHWESDDLALQVRRFTRPVLRQALHIVTDAAGAIQRHQAMRLGITLLDSYVQIDHESLPETCVDPEHLFAAMQGGSRVSTAQASTREREQAYAKILDLHSRALYITVGSFYTGNYEAARAWKAANDPEDRLLLVDSGVASGHLGLAAMAAARFSMAADTLEEVTAFAHKALNACREILFLDKLHFVAAGGRMSKTGAFFGDMLHLKPAFTPTPTGAQKLAVLRSRADQVDLALKQLDQGLDPGKKAIVMLEHTDNRDWVESDLTQMVTRRFPLAYVFEQETSLTSAAHMGPGTWGVAFLQVDELDRLEPFFP